MPGSRIVWHLSRGVSPMPARVEYLHVTKRWQVCLWNARYREYRCVESYDSRDEAMAWAEKYTAPSKAIMSPVEHYA
jgi:hypothetical protein